MDDDDKAAAASDMMDTTSTSAAATSGCGCYGLLNCDSFFDDIDIILGDDEYINTIIPTATATGTHAAAKSTHIGCAHTHTCSPPASPDDLTHTHTCFHVHTKTTSFVPPGPSHKNRSSPSPSCNREAVRKYREKKKEEVASLDDENRQLRQQNHSLIVQLQSLISVQAENTRLKCLLLDLRGRIDGQIGTFPTYPHHQSHSPTAEVVDLASDIHVMSSCDLRCPEDQLFFCTQKEPQGIHHRHHHHQQQQQQERSSVHHHQQ